MESLGFMNEGPSRFHHIRWICRWRAKNQRDPGVRVIDRVEGGRMERGAENSCQSQHKSFASFRARFRGTGYSSYGSVEIERDESSFPIIRISASLRTATGDALLRTAPSPLGTEAGEAGWYRGFIHWNTQGKGAVCTGLGSKQATVGHGISHHTILYCCPRNNMRYGFD